MSWDELKLFAADPLVTIGANAVTHCNLARRTEEIAGAEISLSRARTENRLQSPVAHLAYPHGNKLAAGRRACAWRRIQDSGYDK